MNQQIIMNLAARVLQNNPQIANNPKAQEMISVIQNGNAARGEQLANNICNGYGVSKEEALAQARQYFGL